MTAIDFTALSDCKNPEAYGEICLGCDRCGKFKDRINALIDEVYRKSEDDK